MTRLAFLHGFTQTHRHWHRVAHAVAWQVGDATLVLPDLPGHGLSAHDRRGIDDTAAALSGSIGSATYVGYSMGGRVALHTALLEHAPMERLVLIGATPGIADEGERAERRRLDDERAAHLERVGVDMFLDEWLAAPLFANLPPDPDDLQHRRRNTVAGLAHSLRTAGTGVQRSLWDDLGRMAIPVLVIAGELDAKFTDIGRRMTDRLPDATFVSVPGAGHAAHTEAPDAVATTISTWLAANPPNAAGHRPG